MLIFAIYKNNTHLGNERASNQQEAIKQYMSNAGFELLVQDEEFVKKYNAIPAHAGEHYATIKPNLSDIAF